MKQQGILGRIFDKMLDTMALVAGIFSITIMVLICYLVVMRYLFHKPPAWVLEICEYLLIYITFLSSAWLLRKNGHVRVDIILNWIPSSAKNALLIFTSFLGCLSCCAIAWFGLLVTLDKFSRNILTIQTLRVPEWILFCIIPIGSLFLLLEFLRQTFASFQALNGKSNTTTPHTKGGA